MKVELGRSRPDHAAFVSLDGSDLIEPSSILKKWAGQTPGILLEKDIYKSPVNQKATPPKEKNCDRIFK